MMVRRALAGLLMACLGTATAAAPAPRIETIASGLDHPWSVAFLPDGRVLVTERAGRLRVIAKGQVPGSISGVPKVYEASQGGLFDVVLHPRFASNGLVYLSYAAGTPAANFTRITRARLVGNALVDQKVIFEVSPPKNTPVHYGGRMAFLDDGTLVMTVGDGFDFREQAQRLGSGLGKIIRINDDGSIPANNPFAHKKGAQPSIWSYGHRNEQGLAFDAASGRLYEHEHGPRGGDEVNIITRGGNYGWPIATKGVDYSGASITPFKTYKGMIDGIVIWVPSIAPSGLAVVRGPMFPEWDGDLIVGALAAQEVRRVDLDAAGKVVGQQRIFPEIADRVRDVRVAPDGAIWVTTDDDAGKVLRISR
ncbi:MAG: PQQ-dependent sugar dehydrogenase [Sandarakinorhabdus sp.]|nr:PQQ-dependent sugar dehydrogenase [Sandarakinorhabdus sp.]